jgi:hypothetical protein
MAAALALAALVQAGPAGAGIRPFIWTWDTQILAQGDVELEQWLWARTRAPAAPDVPSNYWIWWGPVFGLTQHLELAVPFQVQATHRSTWLESFEADLRYRIFSRNDDGKFQPLVRAAFHQVIHAPGTRSRLELNLVGSYGGPDELRATLDLGARISISDPAQVVGTYAAGVSYPVREDLRISAEVFGEIEAAAGPTPSDLPHHFVGASVSYVRGRMWITAGSMVGLTPLFPTTPHFMPRLIWAVAL